MKGMKEAFDEVKKVNSGNEEKIGDALEAKWVTVKAEVSGLESRLTTKFGEIKKDVETLEIEKRERTSYFMVSKRAMMLLRMLRKYEKFYQRV